jgi:hypothetical protein
MTAIVWENGHHDLLLGEEVASSTPHASRRPPTRVAARAAPQRAAERASLVQSQPALSVFNRLPTEEYTQGGKFWVRRRRDQELEGARNTRLLDRFGPLGA